jgi:FlaA1/EpsC-like NDP-sugar epimerase
MYVHLIFIRITKNIWRLFKYEALGSCPSQVVLKVAVIYYIMYFIFMYPLKKSLVPMMNFIQTTIMVSAILPILHLYEFIYHELVENMSSR